MRLKLHVGHGKTGSSYLQSWLAANAEPLSALHHVYYPTHCPLQGITDQRAGDGRFSMGNGFVLNPVLESGVSLHKKRRWWRRLLRQSGLKEEALQSLVFSHEPWARRLPARFHQLLELKQDLNWDGIDLWLLVRDPLDHAISVYGQMVKRHGFAGSLEEWLLIYDFPSVLLRFVELVLSHSDRVCLKVDHYGRQRQALLGQMQGWLQVPTTAEWQTAAKATVNRSLSLDELQLMRCLNERLGSKASVVGELLVDQMPNLRPASLKISGDSYDRFNDRWTSVIDAINKYLPESSALQLNGSLDGEKYIAVLGEQDQEMETIRLMPNQLDCLLEGMAKMVKQ